METELQEAVVAVRTRYTIEEFIALEGEFPDRNFKAGFYGSPCRDVAGYAIHSLCTGVKPCYY